jgi:hypothetical protein
MAKKKVRTTAQRRAAALEAWKLRRLRGAAKPTKNHRTPLPVIQFEQESIGLTGPTTAVAIREGSELYVTISFGGSIFRHQLSRDTMRKLGLDCLQLVG